MAVRTASLSKPFNLTASFYYLTTTTMLRLINDNVPFALSPEDWDTILGLEVNDEGVKDYILTKIATSFSDDVDFLRKINKITFGLISKQ